jgi:hypothetical protein
MFSNDEKEYLRVLLKRELEQFKKEGKAASQGAAVRFLKAEHEYGHFLERLMEKLQ